MLLGCATWAGWGGGVGQSLGSEFHVGRHYTFRFAQGTKALLYSIPCDCALEYFRVL